MVSSFSLFFLFYLIFMVFFFGFICPFMGFLILQFYFSFLNFYFYADVEKFYQQCDPGGLTLFLLKCLGSFVSFAYNFTILFYFFLHYCSCAVFVVQYRGSSLILKGVKAKFSLLLPLTNEILTSFFRKLGFVLKVLLLYICCSSKAFAIGMLQIFVCD